MFSKNTTNVDDLSNYKDIKQLSDCSESNNLCLIIIILVINLVK